MPARAARARRARRRGGARVGELVVGDLAVVVATTAAHRGDSFTASRALIDTLKAEVPIWKHQVFDDATRGVGRHPLTRARCASGRRRRAAPTLGRVEILLWLVPSLVVTALAMAWVAWTGRDGRGEVDPDVAVAAGQGAVQGSPGRPAAYARAGARPQHRHRRAPSHAGGTHPGAGRDATRRVS